jgi:hypothetical protein
LFIVSEFLPQSVTSWFSSASIWAKAEPHAPAPRTEILEINILYFPNM